MYSILQYEPTNNIYLAEVNECKWNKIISVLHISTPGSAMSIGYVAPPFRCVFQTENYDEAIEHACMLILTIGN